jgi:hypothetical protein
MPFQRPWASIERGDLIFGLWPAKHEFKPKDGSDKDLAMPVTFFRCDLDDVIEAPMLRPPGNEDFLRNLLKHPKYHAIVNAPTTAAHPANFVPPRIGERPKKNADYLRRENAFLRAKSKGVLWWATTVALRKVHFVLDYVDMDAVVRKNQAHHVGSRDQNFITAEQPQGKAGPGESKYRVITNAELRWVYRHRSLPAVRELVQFWSKGNQCAPPWEQFGWARLWRRHYLPTHVSGS